MVSRYIGVQGRRGSLALAPWKSKLLLGSRVIVPPVISIVTQHKRFLLERKIGNSWKVSPLTIQLLHTHTHIYIFKKITIFQQILHSYLKELFIYHTHLEKVKTRIRIQSHLNSYIIILDKPNQV